MKIGTIGLDMVKNQFQVHGVDEAGSVIVARQLIPKEPDIDLFHRDDFALKHRCVRLAVGAGFL